jgi:hypothetical protein
MWSGTVCAGAIAATALASVALAQTPQDEPATTLEDIEVVGTPEAKTAAAYVRAIGTGPVGRLSPVWRQRICVRIIEMDEEHARFLRSRIETVAAAFGVSTNPSPTCRPDISIYASTDPVALATSLIEAAPRLFQPTPNNTSLGDAALEAFRTSSAPIRWWQVSLPVMAATGQPAIIEGTGETRDPMARSVVVRNASRLTGNVRDDLAGVTIIMDTRRLATTPFGAVSDYVAFVALAPVDPRVPTAAFDTVLNLFDRPGVTGLTMTDQDYLYALYASSPAPASASLQAAEIASRMAAERRRRGQ